jgi:hypothetical protein
MVIARSEKHERYTRRSILQVLAAGFASIGSSVVGLSASPYQGDARQRRDGETGVALLQAWFAGQLPKQRIPSNWLVHAPSRGLAFYYPPDWTVSDIQDPDIYDLTDGNPFGSLIVAPDESAAVMLLNIAAAGIVTATDAGWAQLESALEDERLTELAEETRSLAPTIDTAFLAGRGDNAIGAIVSMTNPDTVTGGTFLYLQLVLAEADVFDRMAERVFVPLLQNLVGDGGSACDTDPDDDDYTLDDCPSAGSD